MNRFTKTILLGMLILCLVGCSAITNRQQETTVENGNTGEKNDDLNTVTPSLSAGPALSTATPSISADPTLNTKDDEPDPTPKDPIPEQAETWDDNGVDGIGVIRGNSNGNLHNKGRAVCDGNYVYYVDQRSKPARICQYDLASDETKVLIEINDVRSTWDIGYLNLIGQDLYFVTGVFFGQTQCIYRISLIDPQPEKIYETKVNLFNFLVAYDRLFITDRQGILICDLNGAEINRIDDYYMCGAMDGILYAYRVDADGCYAIDLNGEVKDYYDTVADPIPIVGYLVDLNNLVGEPLEYKGILTVVAVANHENRSFEVPEISCASYWNISKDTVYLQKYGLDETGEIYRMDWNGNGLTKVDDRIFYTGISLWEDTMLVDLVPCDEWDRE